MSRSPASVPMSFSFLTDVLLFLCSTSLGVSLERMSLCEALGIQTTCKCLILHINSHQVDHNLEVIIPPYCKSREGEDVVLVASRPAGGKSEVTCVLKIVCWKAVGACLCPGCPETSQSCALSPGGVSSHTTWQALGGLLEVCHGS